VSDTREWWVRCDNLIRVSQVPPGETSWECVYLERDYDAVVAERDRLKARGDLYSELSDAFGSDPCDSHQSRLKMARGLKAERDRLAATVKRVMALDRYTFMPTTGVIGPCVFVSDLDRALAEPVCDLCHAESHNYGATSHGFGKCVERRKA